MTYNVIIPARNEAVTVASVVQAARKAPNAARVIVVDDHSSDETGRAAAAAGAEVVLSRGRGKAVALATGVEASDSPLLVFFDADITTPEPGHFEALAAPVAAGRFVMCCGIIDYGPLRNPIFLRLPPITGLRALRRDIFTAIPESCLNGFQIEIMINEVVARGCMPAAIRILEGAGHRSKVEKVGFVRGAIAHMAMTAELLQCLTFVPLWTYRAYLQNLTVLPVNKAGGA